MNEVAKGSLPVSVNDTTYTYSKILPFMEELKRLPVGGVAGFFVPNREVYSRGLIIVVDLCSTVLREDIAYKVVPDHWGHQSKKNTQNSAGQMYASA